VTSAATGCQAALDAERYLDGLLEPVAMDAAVAIA
jgi:hypothetical protein